ncbi:hypothetical protein GGR09_000042 [Bartonella heixiaziensis]
MRLLLKNDGIQTHGFAILKEIASACNEITTPLEIK